MIELPSTAILLVAGTGSRLKPLTDTRPKCLVEVGGRTLLDRCAKTLTSRGVRRFVLSTGYLSGQVEAAVREMGIDARVVVNTDYDRTQNVVSLSRALDVLGAGEPFMKLDGDVLFEPAVLDAMLRRGQETGADAIVAVDATGALGAEEMKVATSNDVIVAFGKGLEPARAAGESIGIEAFHGRAAGLVRGAIGRAVREGRTDVYYEDVYNDVLGRIAMKVALVPSGAWTEIDNLEDLARAEGMFGQRARTI